MNKSYHIETYGCQMNVADSEVISGLLKNEGYIQTKDIHSASIIFVNTCAIREHAEDKVLSRLGFYNQIKQKNPDIIIGVLGCMAQNLKEQILESKPYVDIIHRLRYAEVSRGSCGSWLSIARQRPKARQEA